MLLYIMGDGGYSYSDFYRIKPESTYKTKQFYDKEPLQAETFDNKINYQPKKVEKIKSEQALELENIEKQWESGVYKSKNGFNSHPFSDEANLRKYYHEPNLMQELPLFVPSSKIMLNTNAGIQQQWKEFLTKTRN
jgi:hypothetical protein